ncbi:hypothetical protein XELAEV_18040065mg [Xenopus laevis]|uniref:Knl1 C-terminal RWD domain-containing protein n=1 Tax=Xenopus laevis TaxID=8355 RepID=A0A974C8Y1_XENLA|nr:hypothetical protein XELAEV_18040065mg [Xenopus laevis]
MEMTASNTIHIDAFLEENTNKIDVNSFLASLKSQGEDSYQNIKLKPSTSIDFHSSTESAVQPKMNFKDFLTGLNTEKQTVHPFQESDKENLFPFRISKENSLPGSDLFSTFTQRQTEKKNHTLVFTEHDGGLDMTKCHTTNITAFLPLTTEEFPNNFEQNTVSISTAPSSHDHLQDGFQLNKLQSVSKIQTVLFEDDMDITQSHSICLDNVLRKTSGNPQAPTKGMAGYSFWQKKNLLVTKHKFVSPDDRMDLTKSHTVAIDGKSMESSCAPTSTSLPVAVGNINGISDSTYFSKSIPRQNQDPSSPFHLAVEKTMTLDDEDMDLNTSNTAHIMFGLDPNTSVRRKSIPVVPTSHLFIMNDKTIVSNQDMDLTQCAANVLNTDSCYELQSSNEICRSNCSEPKIKSLNVSKSSFLPKPTLSSDQHKSSNFKEDQHFITTVSISKSIPSAVADKTLLFLCDQDDMEITKSHTVAIDTFLQEPNLTKIPENVPKDKTVKPAGLRRSSFSKHVLFPKASDDTELTKGHVVNEKLWQKAKQPCQISSDHQDHKAHFFGKNNADTKVSATQAVEDDMPMGGLNTNFKREEEKTSITARDKTILFSCEEEDMDMTRSHTVTIDRKDLCKGSKNALNMHITNNVSTFSSEQDFKESHALIKGNKVSGTDGCLKLASNRKSTGEAITDCVPNPGSHIHSVNVPLSEEKSMFSPSKDYMDFTQSRTEFDLYQLKSDVIVEDDMELTKSHTMVISAKCPDQLRNQSIAVKINTEAGFGKDDIITKSNTVCNNEIPEMSKGLAKTSVLRQASAPGPKRSCFANDKIIHREGDMEMTTGNIGLIINYANVPRVKSVGLDKTLYFHQTPLPLNKTVHTVEDDMELTKSHTMVINEQPVGLYNQSDTVNKGNSDDLDITKSNTVFVNEIPEISKELAKPSVLRCKSASGPKRSFFANDKTIHLEGDMEMTTGNIGLLINDANVPRVKTIESKSLCNPDVNNKYAHYSKQTPLPLNKTVQMVEDDMEFTKSHTMVINEQAVGLYNQSDPVNESNYDDITKSNTEFIKETEICVMEMTAANVGLVINDTHVPVQRKSLGPCHDKTLVFSCEQEHMDLTASHTIAIESKGICEVANTLHPNVNCLEYSSVPVNKSTVILEDDMELTKSHTMVINKNQILFVKAIMRQLNCFMKRQSVCLKGPEIAYDQSVHLDANMELTTAGTGLLITDSNAPATGTTLAACNNKTMVFSYEQDNMDFTVSNTVTIESKGLYEGTKTPNPSSKRTLGGLKHPSVLANKTFTMFAEDMEMTKSHTMVIEQKTPLLDVCDQSTDKQSLVNEIFEADVMDITKANTVFIDNRSDGLCKTSLGSRKPDLPSSQQSCFTNEPLHGYTVARMSGENGWSSNAFQIYDRGDTDIAMSHTAVTEKSALNKKTSNSNADRFKKDRDHCSAPACKTIFFSTLGDDMDLSKSHTMVIDGRNILKGDDLSSRHQGQIMANGYKSVAFSSDDMDFTRSPSARLEKGIFDVAQQEEINIFSKSKKGNILDLERPFLNKHTTVNVFMHEGDVELTKSHTVAIELDNQCPSTALSKQAMEPETYMGKSMKSLVNSGCVMSDAKVDMGNIICASTTYSVGEDKTLCNLNEMGMKRSNTVAIENKMEDLQNPVATDNKNYMAENPESLVISLSTSNPKVFVPDMVEKNSNGKVFCEVANKSTRVDQQVTQVVEINENQSAGFGCDTNNCTSVSSVEHTDHITQVCGKNYGPVLKDEVCLPYKDTVDHKTTKKARPKSKRVSFMLPEPETGSCFPKANVLELATKPDAEVNLDECNLKQNFSVAILGMNADQEGVTMSMAECYDANDGLAQGSLVHCKPKGQNTSSRNLEQEDQDTLSCERTVLKSSNLVDFSEADKMRRRSIADIQSKIKSLNRNSKSFPDSQTAPVSFLVDHLSTALQAPSEGLTKKTEQVLEDPELSESNLPNKFSVKIFQPKLPQKASLNKCNVQKSPSASEAYVKPEQNSLTLFKALTNCNTSPCIDEDILPLSPDDKGQDGIFPYEVPEGAWEELCEKEALHCNVEQGIPGLQDGLNEKKWNREPEENIEFQREKRGRTEDLLNRDKSKASATIASPDEYHLSQQCSQMESQLSWDTGCEQSLWEKFQDGTITVKEFFMLLRIRILIQKPRYSELPANSPSDKSPLLRVTNLPEKPSRQLESKLPGDGTRIASVAQSFFMRHFPREAFQRDKVPEEEAIWRSVTKSPRFLECALTLKYRANKAATIEDLVLDQYIYQPKLQVYKEECHALGQIIQELKTFAETQEKPLILMIYFGVKLKSLKSLYSKKSKVLAHERKVTVYSKLLHVAKAQCEQLQSRLNEVDTYLEHTDKCVSELEREMDKLDEDIRSGNLLNMDPTVKGLQTELENLQIEEVNSIRECTQLEERKEQILTQLGCLQEEANKLEKQLEEFNFTEWDLEKWTEDRAIFSFFYDSIELCIKFGDVVGKVKLLFSSSLAYAKFELALHLSESYPTLPLTFTFQNHIGKIGDIIGSRHIFSNLSDRPNDRSPPDEKFRDSPHMVRKSPSNISAVLSEVPVGLWYLKRAVRRIHQQLLV